MKTRYRIIARRQLEAERRLRRPWSAGPALQSSLDDPMEMASELIDLATGKLVDAPPLMEMALAEILHLPRIPVKASLNEYIDISKEYSTPNSKVFVNGVLDKVIAGLKREGRIEKSGRGLKES